MSDENSPQGKDVRVDGVPEEIDIVDVPFPNFYVNNVTINSSFLDFAFTLMERLDAKNQTIKARVVMAPISAKLFLESLINQMAQWEAKFGVLRVPEAALKARKSTSDSSSEPEQPPSQSPNAPSE
jgi:hypothetical protein